MGLYYVIKKRQERKRSPMDLISRPRIGAANDVNKYC